MWGWFNRVCVGVCLAKRAGVFIGADFRTGRPERRCFGGCSERFGSCGLTISDAQLVAKSRTTSVNPASDGADGDVEMVRDLLITETQHVFEDDGNAVFRHECHQQFLQVIGKVSLRNFGTDTG